MEEVILVDSEDREIGKMEKMEAHKKGLLHRAISVFLFNSKGEMLLQQRADGKYHSPGLWTNACCSHPKAGETTQAAAARRLKEEMGIETNLEKKFSFIYKAHLDNGLIEHELDHVFMGFFDHPPQLNPEEAKACKWMNMTELKIDMAQNPQAYTIWFRIILNEHLNHFVANIKP